VKRATVGKAIFDGNVVPAEYLQRTQVVNNRERIELVQTWNYSAILNVRQTANMKNQLRTATARCQFKTGAFDIAIG
jgi:hypothetical protein